MIHHSISARELPLFISSTACVCLLCACGTAEGSNNLVRDPDVHATALADSTYQASNPLLASFNRQEIFTKDERSDGQRTFSSHFMANDNGLKAITDTVQRIPWADLDAQGKIAVPTGKPVAGLYISYGLDGSVFHPILRFMYQDSGGADLQLSEMKAFSFIGGKLILEAHPDAFEQAYRHNIRIDRTGTGNFTSPLPDDLADEYDEPDPYATWFPYADKLNQLFVQNPTRDSSMLVVSCISMLLPYRDLAFVGNAPEYRHLMTLHVGEGAKDLLDNSIPGSTNPLKNHAMDLGCMCPPRCRP